MTTKVVAIDAKPHRARVRARRDELIAAHLSLVEGIARQIARRLPPCFEIDDLVATGNLALLRAATRYRPAAHGGTPFSAFARHGVRGAILDSVRRSKWTEATRQPIEILMNFGSEDLDGMQHWEEIAELERLATVPTLERDIDAGRMATRLDEALSWLPDDQRNVIARFYGGDAAPSLAQVAQRLAFGGERVRELHLLAIEALRARFRLRTAA